MKLNEINPIGLFNAVMFFGGGIIGLIGLVIINWWMVGIGGICLVCGIISNERYEKNTTKVMKGDDQ